MRILSYLSRLMNQLVGEHRTRMTSRRIPGRLRELASHCEAQVLEERMLLTTGWIPLDDVMKDFSAANASQFGGGQAVYQGQAFLGIPSFDTGKFTIDAWDDVANAGAKVDFRLFGKAGIDAGYYINAGSLDVAYDNVKFATRYIDAANQLDYGVPLTIESSVSYDANAGNFFNTTSPTIGAYADLVLQAKTQGSITGRLPWPFNDVGGTISLDRTLLDVDQELFSFNRDGSSQLRLMGEDVFAGGLEMSIPVSKAPPMEIHVAAVQLEDDDGNKLLGLDAAASLSLSGSVDQLLPKSVKKAIEDLDSQKLKEKAKKLGSTPFSVTTDLATMQLNVPQINLSSGAFNATTGELSGSNIGERNMSNLLARTDLNLGLKNTTFTISPASLTLTPFNFQLSPTLYVEQQVTITPKNSVTYRFDRPVTVQVDGTTFSGVRSRTVDVGTPFAVVYEGFPVQVDPDWHFEAVVSNNLTIKSTVKGTLTLADLKVDADISQWIKDLVGLPFDPAPLYQKTFDLGTPATFSVNVGTFPVISANLQSEIAGSSIDTFVLGANVSEGPFLVEHRLDEYNRTNAVYSLREAIDAANSRPGDDSIFLVDGTYRLSETSTGNDSILFGDLDVTNGNLRIVGQGAGKTIIDAGQIDRVFEVSPEASLTLEGVTIQGGLTSLNGGGILNRGNLTLIRCEVIGNAASNGGGVSQPASGAVMTITDTTIAGNTAVQSGGGVDVFQGTATIMTSTISDNTATNNDAGGILAGGSGARITVTSSTISGNTAQNAAGAILVNNSTASLNLNSVTISNNSQSVRGAVLVNTGSVRLLESIVAGNTISDLDDVQGGSAIIDAGYNLIGAAVGSISWQSTTQHGTTSSRINPQLSPLGRYGGVTETHILLSSSPAIGAGMPGSLRPDQRSPLFGAGDPREIGAVQYFRDAVIPAGDGAALSLLIAIFNAQGGANTISLQPGSYLVEPLVVEGGDGNDLDVRGQQLSIIGAGAGLTVIDGRQLMSRVFDVSDTGDLTLRGVTITRGNDQSFDGGGGVRNLGGTLFIEDSEILGNTAVFGGGVTSNGTTTLLRTLVAENRSESGGGVIGSGTGTLWIESSRIHNNVATRPVYFPSRVIGQGGGIWISSGTATIKDTEISANQAQGAMSDIAGSASAVKGTRGLGGGLFISGGTTLIDGSLIHENAAIGGTGRAFTYQSSSLIAGDGGDGFGGGLYISGGNVTLQSSTLTANQAVGGQGSGITSQTNATVSNGGMSRGGAIDVVGGNLLIDSATIARNSAVGGRKGVAIRNGNEVLSGVDGLGSTGGISSKETSTLTTISNSVIAQNGASNTSTDPWAFEKREVNGAFNSQGYNFVGVANASTGFTAIGDRFGVVTDFNPSKGTDLSRYALDPMLEPLAKNGGLTMSLKPMAGSPLVDVGNTAMTEDQRGFRRDVGFAEDIGAVELETLRVETFVDDLNQLSLRKAIRDANQFTGQVDELVIRLQAGTYSLTLPGSDTLAAVGDVDFTSIVPVRIVGLGPGRTVIDGSQLSEQVFEVLSGSLTLEGLTVINGNSSGLVSGVRNQATFTANNVQFVGGSGGGALRNALTGSSMTLRNVTITDHISSSETIGTIHNRGTLTADNLTLAHNTGGGALSNMTGTSNLTNVTISANTTASGSAGLRQIGGTVNLRNSIISGNTGGGETDLSGAITSQGNNLIGNSGTATGLIESDLVNADPGLMPMVTTGLPHFPLSPTSPAIEGGSAFSIPDTDVLGNPRLLGGRPDIGAVEFFGLHVTNAADTMAPGTLRFAIQSANQHPGLDRITFDSSLNGSPVLMTGGQYEISDSLELVGNGALETVLDAQQASRLFSITGSDSIVQMTGMTLQNGRVTGANDGGAILVNDAERLTLSNIVIQDSTVTGLNEDGGAIAAIGTHVDLFSSTLTRNSTLTASAGNQGHANGGAVYLQSSSMRAVNSTLASNSSITHGGAVYLVVGSSLTLENTTIAGNHAAKIGGGVYMGASTSRVTAFNSIIAQNTDAGVGPDLQRTAGQVELNHSLLGNNTGADQTAAPVGSPDADGNLIGTAAVPIDPLFGTLQDNGGGIPTRGIAFASPARNAGIRYVENGDQEVVFTAPSVDQRGYNRGGVIDMGAFEIQSIQNLRTLPTDDITIVPQGDDRMEVTAVYTAGGKTRTQVQIVAVPETRLNTLPFITPVTNNGDTSGSSTIGPQFVTPGSVVGPLFFSVHDLQSATTSLLVTARSGNENLIPSSNIHLGGSGDRRHVSVTVPSGVVGEVPVIITVADPDGTSDFPFLISIAGTDLSGLALQVNDGTSTATRVNLGDIRLIDGSSGNTTVTLTGPDAGSFELEGQTLYLRAGTVVNYATKPSFEVGFAYDNDGLPDNPDVVNSYTLPVNVAPIGVRLENRVTYLFSGQTIQQPLRIGDIVVNDPSGIALNSVTLDPDSPDADCFDIIGDGLYLKAGTTLNHSIQSSLSYGIRVDDPSIGDIDSYDLTQSWQLIITSPFPAVTGPIARTNLQRPEFTWSEVPGAVNYELWVGNQSTRVSPVIHEILNGTSFTPSQDLGIGLYNIWVRAVDAAGHESRWSLQRNTTINTRITSNPGEVWQATSTPTLSWQPLPGAVRYDIWIDNISTGQSQFVRNTNITETSYTPASPLSLGSYRAWVRGLDASGLGGLWSNVILFHVVTPPHVTAGQNSTFDRTPTFAWNPVPGAVEYEVFIRNRNTGATVVYQRHITGTSWTMPADLPDGPYRWWAIGINAQNQRGFWTNPMDIYVGGRTDMLTPVGSTTSRHPVFSWRIVDGASRYELWVDRIGGPAAVIHETSLQATSFTPSTPLTTGHYRAWVRAVSTTGEVSGWSLSADFTVAQSSELNSDETLDIVILTSLLPDTQPQPHVIPASCNEATKANEENYPQRDLSEDRPAGFAASDHQIVQSDVAENSLQNMFIDAILCEIAGTGI